GTAFAVGTSFSDAQREQPPPVGSLITFRYPELSEAGVPRFPSFVGVRAEAALATPTPKPTAAAGRVSREEGSVGRRFELVERKSSKFWEITVAGPEVTVRYGRIGTQGQTIAKASADAAAAARHAAKLIAEKTAKGYGEVS